MSMDKIDNTVVNKSITLPKWLNEAIGREAAKNGLTDSAYLRIVAARALGRRPDGERLEVDGDPVEVA